MKVLFCSSEVAPFAKTGGLADVSGSLPAALEAIGLDVRIVMPKYRCVKSDSDRAKIADNITVHFVDSLKFFDRDGLYGNADGDHADNLERFSYFCRAILELAKKDGFKPDIIHCNDWQTALVCVYLKALYKDDPFFSNTKTVFSIHNLAYQGIFEKTHYEAIGLGWEFFTIDGFEFYDKVNLMKAGIIYSDIIATVSPTYSREVQTPEFGCGLEGVLKNRSNCLFGILNGIDHAKWDPSADRDLIKNYTAKTITDKAVNKTALQKETGLKEDKDVPLLGIVGRLAEQKGIDILSDAIDELFKSDVQLILLGTGDLAYHDLLEEKQKEYPKKLSVNIKFDAALAKRIYAGSDFFLMPSKYEPCGLGQLISFRYGTIPIARKTGGLTDTILEYDPDTEEGNGFLFKEYSAKAFNEAIKAALAAYKDKDKWHRLIGRCMGYDFSWNRSAQEYKNLYEGLLK